VRFITKNHSKRVYEINRAVLIDKIAEGTDITRASAGREMDSMINAITEDLADGGDVESVGFGPFKVSARTFHKTRSLKRVYTFK